MFKTVPPKNRTTDSNPITNKCMHTSHHFTYKLPYALFLYSV